MGGGFVVVVLLACIAWRPRAPPSSMRLARLPVAA